MTEGVLSLSPLLEAGRVHRRRRIHPPLASKLAKDSSGSKARKTSRLTSRHSSAAGSKLFRCPIISCTTCFTCSESSGTAAVVGAGSVATRGSAAWRRLMKSSRTELNSCSIGVNSAEGALEAIAFSSLPAACCTAREPRLPAKPLTVWASRSATGAFVARQRLGDLGRRLALLVHELAQQVSDRAFWLPATRCRPSLVSRPSTDGSSSS